MDIYCFKKREREIEKTVDSEEYNFNEHTIYLCNLNNNSN